MNLGDAPLEPERGEQPRAIPRCITNLVAFALSVLVAEGLSYVGLTRLPQSRALLRRDFTRLRDTVTAEQIAAFRDRGYDQLLGWSYRPGSSGEGVGPDQRVWRFAIDERGARRNPFPGDVAKIKISVYGDSMAFCAEVNDDETWEYDLSWMTGTAVLNFGVTAYGTDQAVWRLAQNLPRYRTPIVVLTVFSEDIARMLSMYRPFYAEETAVPVGFKPMLYPVDGTFELLPNPLVRAESRQDFLDAFDTARRYDFWYALNERKPKAAFPYSVTMLRAVMFRLFDERDVARLYQRDEGRLRMFYILEQFVALSKQHAFQPVVLFVPTPVELKRARRGAYSYKPFLNELRLRMDLGRLRIVDLADRDFDAARFNTLPYKGHASPYGNHVIAEAVFDGVRDLITRTE